MSASHRPLVDVSHGAPFAVSVSDREESVAVSVYGRLERATVPEAEDAIDSLGLRPGRLFLLDVRALSSIDRTGLELLTRLGDRSRRDGWTLLVIRRPEGPVTRALDGGELGTCVVMVDAPMVRGDRAERPPSRRPT